ncbi:hypothetical protein Tco_1040999 [Tanacetum coccineum]|uniref:Uncharacterized protein n=1 Tax=Tanacetum coccineum TaxID=301880 RepID=A0ABQ5GFK1_9ASTR
MKELMKIVPGEKEVAVDAILLATKPLSIVDWKIVKEGKISYYQIIRADGSSKRYSAFIQMLRSFDREDLETLWKLVKPKHGYTRPEEGYKRVLWGDLKTMFEHHVEDAVWRNLHENKVLVWKLFDSCRVHFVSFLSSSQSNSRINEVFGSILLVKTINGEAQLHARVDGKKIIITESTVRRNLQLEDAEGDDCLPNATIFEQLTLMGPKTTVWNEFSSTMASAITCLAKFNFSKLIFESMMKNLDNVSGKFLMYPRLTIVDQGLTFDDLLLETSGSCALYPFPCPTDNQAKDEKQSQNDKTGLGMEKQEKTKSKSKPKPEKVNPSQPRGQKSRNISLGTKLVKP